MATYSTETVLHVQESLNKLGSSLVEDGLYGNNTKTAIMDFQRSKGLLPTGAIDTDLIKALSSVVATTGSSFSMSEFWSANSKKILLTGSAFAFIYGIYFINTLREKGIVKKA